MRWTFAWRPLVIALVMARTGDEFNSSGKTATLNDGEPLDLTANFLPDRRQS